LDAGAPSVRVLPDGTVVDPGGRLFVPTAVDRRELDGEAVTLFSYAETPTHGAGEGWVRLEGDLYRENGLILLRREDARDGLAYMLDDGSLLLGEDRLLRPDGAVVRIPREGVALGNGQIVKRGAAPLPPAGAASAISGRAGQGGAEAAAFARPHAGPKAPAQDAAAHEHEPELRWSSTQDICCSPRGPLRGWTDGDAWYENMELGITMDTIGEFSEVGKPARADLAKFDRYNRLRIRSLQLHAAARLDWMGWAYASVDFADGSGGSQMVLREAAAWIDALPWGFSVRAGKYYADFGNWNRYYVNELPSPNMAGVRRAYMGGNLVATGVEVHQRNDWDRSHLRWSVGIAPQWESHDVDAVDNGLTPAAEAQVNNKRRGVDNWAATARLEWEGRIASDWGLRLGASGFHAPRRPNFTTVSGPDGILGSADDKTVRGDIQQTLLSGDVTVTWEHDEHDFDAVTAEVLWDNSELPSLTGTRRREASLGGWLMYRHGFDEHWSVGAQGSLWQKRNIAAETQAVDVQSWLAYHFTPSNRIQVFAGHRNPGGVTEKWFTVGAQWTLTFGSPRRGHSLRWLPDGTSAVAGEQSASSSAGGIQ
ncbi:MAG TPA: hypothetical protein VGC54_02955, partial [Planctomycetota bacterium]